MGKVKIVPVPNKGLHHEDVWRSLYTIPCFLDLDIKWKWLFSFSCFALEERAPIPIGWKAGWVPVPVRML
jgi:hypothetical protein